MTETTVAAQQKTTALQAGKQTNQQHMTEGGARVSFDGNKLDDEEATRQAQLSNPKHGPWTLVTRKINKRGPYASAVNKESIPVKVNKQSNTNLTGGTGNSTVKITDNSNIEFIFAGTTKEKGETSMRGNNTQSGPQKKTNRFSEFSTQPGDKPRSTGLTVLKPTFKAHKANNIPKSKPKYAPSSSYNNNNHNTASLTSQPQHTTNHKTQPHATTESPTTTTISQPDATWIPIAPSFVPPSSTLTSTSSNHQQHYNPPSVEFLSTLTPIPDLPFVLSSSKLNGSGDVKPSDSSVSTGKTHTDPLSTEIQPSDNGDNTSDSSATMASKGDLSEHPDGVGSVMNDTTTQGSDSRDQSDIGRAD
jgi:hypothetical protein